MKRLLLLAWVAVAGPACAPKTGATPAAGAPPVERLMHGLWSGTASESPLGEQPYAIVFRKEGTTLVAETPPVLGEETLPIGAYQRFEFPEGPSGKKAKFKTAMGKDGFLDGDLELDGTRSTASKAVYCVTGNCGSMELRWEALAEDKMSFQVSIDGRLHVDIHLQFDGDM